MTPITRNTHSVRLARSYAPDWILALVLIIATFLFDRTTPFKRQFSLDDKTISFPFAVVETVSVTWLGIIAIVIPIFVICLLAIVCKRSAYDFHNGALGLLLALALTLTLTSALKNTLGRLRPDFLDRCQITSSDLTDPKYKLTTMEVCSQQNRHIFEDGMKSFPSGHSSTSFASMTFLALFIAGKTHLFDNRGHTWKPIASIVPLICATLVAISRVDDYRHHWQDVVIGALIGITFASFSYHQYHPSLWSSRCEKPHSPRVPRHLNEVVIGMIQQHPAQKTPGNDEPSSFVEGEYQDDDGESVDSRQHDRRSRASTKATPVLPADHMV